MLLNLVNVIANNTRYLDVSDMNKKLDLF
jgi:hypothetical protein